jgi:hypothetical protein
METVSSRDSESAADQAFQLVGQLDCQPALAYVVDFDSSCDYSPTLDIAVRLLASACQCFPVHDGRTIWSLLPGRPTQDEIAAAAQIVRDCIAALRASGEPFALLTHVHGQTEVQFHFGGQTWEQAMESLKHTLSEEVLCFT